MGGATTELLSLQTQSNSLPDSWIDFNIDFVLQLDYRPATFAASFLSPFPPPPPPLSRRRHLGVGRKNARLFHYIFDLDLNFSLPEYLANSSHSENVLIFTEERGGNEEIPPDRNPTDSSTRSRRGEERR